MVRAAVVWGLGVVVAEAVRGTVELRVGVSLLLRRAPVVIRLVGGSAPGAPLVDPKSNLPMANIFMIMMRIFVMLWRVGQFNPSYVSTDHSSFYDVSLQNNCTDCRRLN